MFDFLLIPWPWLSVPILLIGFIPLIKGADLLVDGAASLAQKFNIPPLVIGLTIVAFGTSAPELVVNVFAAISKNTDIALGNILGSNIANILLILGVSALFGNLMIQKSTRTVEIPLVILISGLLWTIANDGVVDGLLGNVLGRADGIVLLVFFVIFLFYNFDLANRGGGEVLLPEVEEVSEHVKPMSVGVALSLIMLGLVGLFLGGKMVVEGAVVGARSLGISERIIGLTIVSVGTSLPELVTSVVATLKKQQDMAVGNIVGSNIFNILLILGITAIITPVPVIDVSQSDLVVNILVSVLLLLLVYFGQSQIKRWHGFLLTACYLGYLGLLFLLGRG